MRTLWCDVDDTLLLWRRRLVDVHSERPFPDFPVSPNTELIELLHEWKALGNKIVMWSSGGKLWAKEARDLLRLNDIVSECLTKDKSHPEPGDVFIDDDPLESFASQCFHPVEVSQRSQWLIDNFNNQFSVCVASSWASTFRECPRQLNVKLW